MVLREIACLIDKINQNKPQWNLIGFFDDNNDLKKKRILHHLKCLGNVDDLNYYPKTLGIIIAIGNAHVVQSILSRLNNSNLHYPNIIHPNLDYADSDTTFMGQGNIFQGGCFCHVMFP